MTPPARRSPRSARSRATCTRRLLDQRERRSAEGANQQGLGLIIVDHIQLIHAWSRNPIETNRVSELSVISRTLKELARELHVPVLAALPALPRR